MRRIYKQDEEKVHTESSIRQKLSRWCEFSPSRIRSLDPKISRGDFAGLRVTQTALRRREHVVRKRPIQFVRKSVRATMATWAL